MAANTLLTPVCPPQVIELVSSITAGTRSATPPATAESAAAFSAVTELVLSRPAIVLVAPSQSLNGYSWSVSIEMSGAAASSWAKVETNAGWLWPASGPTIAIPGTASRIAAT